MTARTKRTFNEILSGLETTNSERLMRRARRANGLARRLQGRNRRKAYEVKARALSFLVRNLPGRTDIRTDIVLTDFVIVELKGSQQGLHMPVSLIKEN